MSIPAAAIVPAREGAQWVAVSLRLFRAQWLRYTSLAALFLLIMQVLSALTGGFAVMLLKPILTVGFLAAAWHHERGQVPELSHLFLGFRSNWKALLPMGIVYLAGVILAALIAMTITGIDLEPLMKGEGNSLTDPSVSAFLLLTVALTLPVTGALWFAPALVVFADATFTQAIRHSLAAWLRNIPAMTVYGITLTGLLFAIALVISPLLLLVGQARATLVIMLVALPVTAVLMISDYVTYRAVFHRFEELRRA